MKRGLHAALLLLVCAKFALTLTDTNVWPLSPYSMFSYRMYSATQFLRIRGTFERGERTFSPWELMPMDMYRSYRLLSSGEQNWPLLRSALLAYHAGGAAPVFRGGRDLAAFEREKGRLVDVAIEPVGLAQWMQESRGSP